jgi:glycosyltransferase involved in cell wall biosynthesis
MSGTARKPMESYRASGVPRFSIGMPVFNGAQFMREAIESILAQTVGDLELIISDNGSSDGTDDIARAFAAGDTRVRYYRQDANLGAAQNYNFVASRARGEFFKWAAHDDLVAPSFLEDCVRALSERRDAVVAFTNTTIIDDNGVATAHFDYTKAHVGTSPSARLRWLLLEDEPFVRHCFPISGLIRAEALRRTTLIGAFQSADRVLLAQLVLLGNFVLVPDRLFLRRWHSGTSRRAQSTPEQIARWFDPSRNYGFPRPRTTVAGGYWRAVERAPISTREKLRCLRVVVSWFLSNRRWRIVLGELRITVTERLRARLGRIASALGEAVRR